MTLVDRPAPADLVIDTSAIMAVLLGERTASAVGDALRAAKGPIIAAPTRTELSIVAAARAANPVDGANAALAILDAAGTATTPVDEPLADLAFAAWLEFGTGRHAARLNFGDVFSYATAAHWELPLLCVATTSATPTSNSSTSAEPLVSPASAGL